MKRDLFAELQAGIKEVGAHRRGKKQLKTTPIIPNDKIDVRNIRKTL